MRAFEFWIPRVEPPQRVVQVRMVAEQLAVRHQGTRDVGTGVKSFSDGEECRLDVVTVEDVADPERVGGVGAVVEGKRNLAMLSGAMVDE